MRRAEQFILGRPQAVSRRLWNASERIAQAVAHPIRIRILTSLNTRAMSPKEFSVLYPEYGISTIAKHFRRLEALGYIEEVGRGPYGSRIFGIRTNRVFDESSLERLGWARTDWTGAVSSSYAERIAEALETETFGSRGDSRFLWTPLYLDERAWNAAILAIDALFYYGFWLHIEAQERLREGGEESISATAGFGCFESPDDGEALPIVPPIHFSPSSAGSDPSELLVEEAVLKGFGHPIRIKILSALNRRPLSPKEFCQLHPEYALQVVAKHFRRLEELGWIELLKERAAVTDTNVFCLRPEPARFDQSNYAVLPRAIRQDAESVLTTTYLERLADAVVANTISSRPESHLSWSGFRYDLQAWTELVTAIDSVYHFAIQLQHHSVRRLGSEGGHGIPVTLACACFPSPQDAKPVDDETLQDILRKRHDPAVERLGEYLQQLIERSQKQPPVTPFVP